MQRNISLILSLMLLPFFALKILVDLKHELALDYKLKVSCLFFGLILKSQILPWFDYFLAE